jgi:hypothetical protein
VYHFPVTPAEQQQYYDACIQQIMQGLQVNIDEATRRLGRELYPEPHQLHLWESFVNTQGAHRDAVWGQQQAEFAARKEQARAQCYGTGKHVFNMWLIDMIC